MIGESIIIVTGSAAVTLSSLRLLPQIIKSFRTEEVDDISLSWEIIGVVSQAFWVAYGILRNDPIIYIGSAIILAFFLLLVFQKFKFKKKN